MSVIFNTAARCAFLLVGAADLYFSLVALDDILAARSDVAVVGAILVGSLVNAAAALIVAWRGFGPRD